MAKDYVDLPEELDAVDLPDELPPPPGSKKKKGTGTMLGDVTAGIGAGVIGLPVGAYKLTRKLLPSLPEVSPFIESLTEPPDTPAGKLGHFAEQAAEFAIPGGAITKATKAAKVGTLGRMAAEGLGAGAVSAVQSGGDPTQTGVAAATGAIAPGIGAALKVNPQRLYQSALKPTWTMAKKEGTGLIEAGLREKIPVSDKGLDTTRTLIDSIQKEVESGIQAHGQQGATIDSGSVLQRLDDLKRFWQNTTTGKYALEKIADIENVFKEMHGQSIPIETAQQIKINTYRELKNAYGEMAAVEAESKKQIARGIKEEISKVFPEISQLNERQSKLLGLEDAIERAVFRIENQQMVGLGTPVAAMAGRAIGGPTLGTPGMTLSLLGKLVLDSPEVKSKLAIALSKSSGAREAISTGLKGVLQEGVSGSAKSKRSLPPPPSSSAGLPPPPK